MRLIINVNDENEKEKSNEEITIDCRPIDHVRVFDEACYGWERNHEYNLRFIRCQQQYANDILNKKGFIFLNEVYTMFGLPPSKAGQIVGWIKGEGKFVDFGLESKLNERFMNGDINTAVLEFNVDGEILSKL